MGSKLVIFGAEFPDIGRLCADTGISATRVTALVDELAHILKTATRLGLVIDLAHEPDDWTDSRGEHRSPDRERILMGHSNALDLNEELDDELVFDLLDAGIALSDRLGPEEDYYLDFINAFASQVSEQAEGRARLSVQPRFLGREADVESEIYADPSVLEFHGYVLTRITRQPHYGSAGRGDLLCEVDDGSLLVIELKRHQVSDWDLPQVQRYMDHVRSDNPGVVVQGLLIGDGIDYLGFTDDWPVPGWPGDVRAIAARQLDLPLTAAQRWLWWQQQPDDDFTPDAVIAVAANSTTMVRVWPRLGRPLPEQDPNQPYGFDLLGGWSCPVPLWWDRDPSAWSRVALEDLVTSRMEWLSDPESH